MNETLLAAATQPRHEIVRSFTDGDTAIIEGVFTARHTGPMPTPDGQIPPTGNTVSFPFSCFFRSATAAACLTTSTTTTWR